ncbi:MAG: exo-alpha-sialidase [Chlamydiae bacterium]|nr:exo-alpha-sialidase [Chlamydiota bacterium]MBI3277622.1 exo-alpha-sialidase [Chlamydiota bacterium]
MFQKIGFMILFSSLCSAWGEGPSAQELGKGIYRHQVLSATSYDSIHWTPDGKVLFDHASVPDAVITKEGVIFLYFMDASQGHDLAVAISSDFGKTWKKEKVMIEDKARMDAVDPCPVLIKDGKIRLYYYGNFGRGPMGPPFGNRLGEGFEILGKPVEKDHLICCALSDDGIHFKGEELCLSAPNVTDPDVIKIEDGWKMFLSQGRDLLSASSSDGVKFVWDGKMISRSGAVSKTIAVNGGYRTYKSGRGIESQFTTDFLHWQEEGVCLSSKEGEVMGDPSVILLPDGTYKMFYKRVRSSPLRSIFLFCI